MGSVVANLLAQAAERPETAAYVDERGVLTYRELARNVERAAALLAGSGVRAGDVIGLSIRDEPESARRGLYLLYGLGWIGAAALPLYPEMPRAGWPALLDRFGARLRIGGRFFGRAGAHPPAPRGDRDERPFLYHFSSGTTGEPKAVCFTHGELAAQIAAGAPVERWSAGERLVVGRPWPSKVAVRYVMRLHAVGGAVVRARFPRTRDEVAHLMRESGVTALFGGPTAMRALLASPAPAQGNLAALRALRVGGGIVRPEELRALRSEITPNVYHGYGCTEAGAIGVLPPEDPVGEAIALRLCAPGLEVEAVDERDAPLPPGATGRLRYRAPWIPRGYVGNPAQTARHFRDGWFYNGDLGAIDAAGRLTLGGRNDDLINFCGVKIAPHEIEPVLLRHPGIAEAALVGVPDAKAGQLAVAFIVPRGARLDLDALRRYCHEQCGELRTPARFVTTRALPRNAAGKIERERLIARFQELLELHSSPPRGTPSSRKP
jgi:acyl-coenzyme A synthetase/AMP-(fatty) acid ligase